MALVYGVLILKITIKFTSKVMWHGHDKFNNYYVTFCSPRSLPAVAYLKVTKKGAQPFLFSVSRASSAKNFKTGKRRLRATLKQ